MNILISFLRSLNFFVILFFIGGCTYFQKEPLHWGIGAVVPQHYDAWVEPLQLETSGIRGWRVPQGYTSCCWKEPWNIVIESHTPPPNYVVVRWFAFAERKLYGRQIRLPADLEERMRRKTPVVLGNDQVRQDHQGMIVLGLAPGGQIVVWLMNQAQNAEEIMRIQAFELDANVEEYDVWIKSHKIEHGEYVKQHGLQYDRW